MDSGYSNPNTLLLLERYNVGSKLITSTTTLRCITVNTLNSQLLSTFHVFILFSSEPTRAEFFFFGAQMLFVYSGVLNRMRGFKLDLKILLYFELNLIN